MTQKKFNWELLSYKVEKHPVNEDGTQEKYVNKRTMAKKALKAYLKGERFYKYKGQLFIVPVVPVKS